MLTELAWSGLYISCLDSLSLDEDFMITIHGKPIPRHTVNVAFGNMCLLEVDVEKAWDEMSLKSGWSNEVQIKISFSS